MKEFKRLDFPRLREYYTKYPQGYTLYESLLDILEHINEMTDVVNLTLNQWEQIETWVLNELKNYSIDQFQTLLDNGTLEEVIIDSLDTVLSQVNSQLAQKPNKGEISVFDIDKNKGLLDETFLSDTLKAQMAGTTEIGSTPPDGSITLKKTSFFKEGKNLFNQETVTHNSYIHDDGITLITGGNNDNYYTSDYIKIGPNMRFSSSLPLNKVVAYNENKQPIPFGNGYVKKDAFHETEGGAYYIRFSALNTDFLGMQIELGESKTHIEPYRLYIEPKYIKGFIPEDLNHILPTTKIEGFEIGKNLFNKNKVTKGYYVTGNGYINENSNYAYSDKIYVKPNTQYTRNILDQITFFDSEGRSVGWVTYEVHGGTPTFTTPSTTNYIIVSLPIAQLGEFQLEEGNKSTSYEPYMIKFEGLPLNGPIYTLNDAWTSWMKGEKFPIAFYGDSTVDGAQTTDWFENAIGTDHNPPNTFSMRLQNLIKESTGNNNLRIYNAGFRGSSSSHGVSYFEREFTGVVPYSDVKMIGIGFGINDRIGHDNVKSYREVFKQNIKEIIKKCFDNNIQPFLMTTQATIEPGVNTLFTDEHLFRTSMNIDVVANEVKYELAKEYELEIIDINTLTEKFIQYSRHSVFDIIQDRLHFKNVGHQYIAELLFAHIIPITNIINGPSKLDYSTQKVKSIVPDDLLTIPQTVTDDFKVYANYTKNNTDDELIYEIYFFVDMKKQLKGTAYKGNVNSNTYMLVNGQRVDFTDLEKDIGEFDLGLHKIQVFSGESNIVDFKGFKLE